MGYTVMHFKSSIKSGRGGTWGYNCIQGQNWALVASLETYLLMNSIGYSKGQWQLIKEIFSNT